MMEEIGIKRFAVPEQNLGANANIKPLYDIENEPWIWHPDCVTNLEPIVLLFENNVKIDELISCNFHISADERFELSINGVLCAIGPDRCDLAHWSFHSYELTLPAGNHLISILVWRLHENAPAAQLSHNGGLIVQTNSNTLLKCLCTSSSNWKVKKIMGWSFHKPFVADSVGFSHRIDAQLEFESQEKFVNPVIVFDPIVSSNYGLM